MISGIIIINKTVKNIKEIGLIKFNNDRAFLKIDRAINEIDMSRFKIKVSNLGYKGMSNYKPPLTLGALSSHDGINTILIYNDKESYKFDIYISSYREYLSFNDLIELNYEKI